MNLPFTFTQFLTRFPDDDSCLDEIKKQRFPQGIHCVRCNEITSHYKLQGRAAYSCTFCRNHVYPLSGTLFEKSSTPLRFWFLTLFLMTHTRGELSSKQLQREIGVTYKTAWRMHKKVRMLMEQYNGDLLQEPVIMEQYRERKWVFFNKFEIKVVQKQEPATDDN